MANRRFRPPLSRSKRSRKRQTAAFKRLSQRKLQLEQLEDRRLLAVGPQLIGIQPNVGSLLQEGDVRNVAPADITFRFDDNQVIDADTLNAIQITRSGRDLDFGTPQDELIEPGWIGIGASPNEVIVRFAERLPDDIYRIDVFGSGDVVLRNEQGEAFNEGEDFQLEFTLDLGAQVISVVPQPVIRQADGSLDQLQDQIVIYFNEDELDPERAEDPAFYQLIFTNDTVSNTDDIVFNPVAIDYDAQTHRAVLTFSDPLYELAGPGTYRLRVGTDEPIPQLPNRVTPTEEPGTSFDTAFNVGALGAQSQIISGSIDPQFYPLEWPGGSDEPGHRNIREEVETHLHGPADHVPGITQAFYNFQDFYGFDPEGNPLQNLITERQKQRAREIFEIYSNYLGIQFTETDNLGMTIVTGDMRALVPDIPTGPGGIAGVAGGGLVGMAIMDNAESWNDQFGANWFHVAMHEIGHLLGLGHSYELPPITIQGSEPILAFDTRVEPFFPGEHDIVHGRHLHRPESIDIDMFQFELQVTGLFTAETFAQRLPESSQLDTVLRLYKQVSDDGGVGSRQLIAQNDDYFGNDSYIEMELEPGVYYIGVSASGNDNYDPTIENTGIGGTSQGAYDLRLDFRPDAFRSIRDITGTALDGNHDGLPGGVFNFWFRTAAPRGLEGPNEPRTIFVDKSASPGGDGSLQQPYNNIANSAVVNAFANARPGDIVRIVGNGGNDGDMSTLEDNLAYEIGFSPLGGPLSDGSTMEVPRGVTVMIDEGAIFKLRRARIGVGSSTASVDRSAGALQVLGTPDHQVFFTSFNDEMIGQDNDPFDTPARAGDWGGLVFRNDRDRVQERFDYEREGIFLNHVNHADIRHGGGVVVIDGIPQVVTPIHMTQARPTVGFNTITRSSDAALSADPNSFEETNFHSPRYQATEFTSDYDRVGPHVHGNRLLNNSTNGLFIRALTFAGEELRPMTVSGRWDNTDVVYVLSENLRIQGQPGGPFLEVVSPPVGLVTLTPQAGGTLEEGTYDYRIVFVDAAGNEGVPSDPTREVEIAGGPDQGSIRLNNLPAAPGDFVARRIYRSVDGGEYIRVAQIDRSSTSFTDDGTTAGGTLAESDPFAFGSARARIAGRLAIDPGAVVKMEGARIETGLGAQLIAEGVDGRQVIFTSLLDDRYGAAGTFDTNNDGDGSQPSPGDWGGIYVGHVSSASIDYSLITFGGGVIRIEGTFAGFNPLEIHQADVRVTNSVFERNDSGVGGQAPSNRLGRGFNDDGAIFVRGAQPIIVNNIIRDNAGPAININANALNHELVVDWGRSRGGIDLIRDYRDNQGPLVRENRLDNNDINGMRVRGETLSTQVVWDDTDIVHVVLDTIYIPDFHSFGGLRLQSSSTESLVVKLEGPTAGFTATGRPLDIPDRIGGMLHIVGKPGSPVVLTSLNDDSVGAGSRPDGSPQTNTNNDADSVPQPGDWRSIQLDQFSHDRNVEVIVEDDAPDLDPPGRNSTPENAQHLGSLAPHEKAGDENRRLGFDVHGFLNSPRDVDVYSFNATAGTEVWFDIGRTTNALDSVVELIDANGNVIARSTNSWEESNSGLPLFAADDSIQVNPLQSSMFLSKDHWSTNIHDAGMRVVLPGTAGSRSTYYVRVRSNSPDLDDLSGGLTSGVYQLQLRLRELDELPGSTIRHSDIRFATNGIELFGLPKHSPLLGEVIEAGVPNNTIQDAQPVGNILNTDRGAMSIAGFLDSPVDVDFYQFEIQYDSTQGATEFIVPNRFLSTVFDIDYADGMARPDTRIWVFDEDFNLILTSERSNVDDDRPAPLMGANIDDLLRGSVGAWDPFIGPAEMPEGTYYVAVSSNSQLAAELDQFVTVNPTNPLVRLEPNNALRRIAEDRIGSFGGSNVAMAPHVPVLFDTQASIVPWHLGDVHLFVSQPGGLGVGDNRTNLRTVNPFTGALTSDVAVGVFEEIIGDIAMRFDGRIFTFNTFRDIGAPDPFNHDANIANYLELDPATADSTLIGNAGIETWMVADPEARAADPRTPPGVGIAFNAITFAGDDDLDGFAVGNRGGTPGQNTGVTRLDNILYRFDINTGEAVSQGTSDRTGCGDGFFNCRFQGAGTQIVERGQIITSSSDVTAVDATVVLDDETIFQITDGMQFIVTNSLGQTQTFEFDSGPEVRVDMNQGIRDGDFFRLDANPTPTGLFGDHYQFETGPVLVIDGDGQSMPDGHTITLIDTTGQTVIFEYVDQNAPPRPGGGRIPIPYTAGSTQAQLVAATVNSINNVGILGIQATAMDNRITLINDQISDNNVMLSGILDVDTADSNVTQLSADPARLHTIQVPEGGGADLADGETFVINAGPATVTFEFVDTDERPDPSDGMVGVFFTSADDADAIASAIVDAIQDTELHVVAENVGGDFAGDGFVQIRTGLTIEGWYGEAPIVQSVNSGVISDGQFFIVEIDGSPVRFEFEKDDDGVTPGSVPVRIGPVDTPAEVSQKIADAVNRFIEGTAKAVGDKLVMNGRAINFDAGDSPLTGVPVLNRPPNEEGDPVEGLIRVEETDDLDTFTQAIVDQLFLPIPIDDVSDAFEAPIEIESEDHGLVTGQTVTIAGVTGNTWANGTWTVTRIDDNNFSLQGSGPGLFDYDGGGFWVQNWASAAGERINFLGGGGPGRFDFAGTPVFQPVPTSAGGVSFGAAQLGFLAADTAEEIAQRMADILNRELGPVLQATAIGATIQIDNGTVISADDPLIFDAAGAGGTVTGIAIVGGTMFAVDDNGGLYSVAGHATPFNVTTTFINSFEDDQGNPVQFSGLTAGPPTVEGGRYANVLFGIDNSGTIHAFDTAGVSQPIFVDAATSIDTGLSGAHGLAFSNLDVNLWHVTNNRNDDPGHGVNLAHDHSRDDVEGGNSLYFGFESLNANGGFAGIDPLNDFDYNFPGGAHGSLESNTFSLEGYTANDLPVLYFNYFLDTEDTDFNPFANPDDPMLDSLRVFIAHDDGDWQLLGTNNLFRHESEPDEFELGAFAVDQDDHVNGRRGVQELYDSTDSWRQVRIELGEYAGFDNLRLRIDFSTAGAMNTGDPMTTGDELRAVAGTKLRDGDTFTIAGQVFEFDMGYTLVAPSSVAINVGQTFTINNGRDPAVTFEFVKNGSPSNPNHVAVQIGGELLRSGGEVAQAIHVAIGSFGPAGVVSHLNSNRVNLEVQVDPTDDVPLDPLQLQVTASSGPNVVLEGSPGVATFAVPVPAHSGMSAMQVADTVQQSLADTYSSGILDNIKRYREVVRVIGRSVTNPGPLGLTNNLQGDQFGAFTTAGPPQITDYPGLMRGMNNNFEGVYIDDIIIGFAGRGEMVTGASGNSTFISNPLLPDNAITQGAYQLEIRPGTQYGFASRIFPYLIPFESFDVNDRFTRQATIVAPSSDQLVDGQTFTLSDGLNSITFEFEDLSIGDGVRPGNLPVPFNTLAFDSFRNAFMPEPDYIIASRIRDAINSPEAQSVLNLTASLGDGATSGFSTSNRVNLHGNAVIDLIPLHLVVTETTTDGNRLRDTILGPGITAVGNASFVGSSVSAGFFEGGRSSIGIDSGILLTTGDANFATGPNTTRDQTGFASLQGDADLDAEFGFPGPFGEVTEDTTVLEFDFQFGDGSIGGDLFFNFVFASEEYNNFANTQFNDVFAFFVNGENIAFLPGTDIPISVNTVNGGNPFGVDPVNPQFYNNNDPDDGGQFLDLIGYDGFTTVFTAEKLGLGPGTHTIKLAISDVGDQILDSGVFIEAASFSAEMVDEPTAPTRIPGIIFDRTGETNRFRDQGQLLIQANKISDSLEFGIVVDADQRDRSDLAVMAGDQSSPVRNLRELNDARLTAGPVLMNNLIVAGGQGGIFFGGDVNPAGLPLASASFGRIVNNTIFGNGNGDVGIEVGPNASPTLLNNIVANFGVGVQVDSSSSSTVMGGMLFQNNATNNIGIGLGAFPIVLEPDEPLFVDAENRNFYPAAGSRAIDSSIDSLDDRSDLVRVKQPLGIAPSPILAPERDLLGQLRVDDPDVSTPSGIGTNVFKDRGAIDRADFVGPTAVILRPRDNDAAGVDLDPTPTVIQLAPGTVLSRFEIELVDGFEPADPAGGTGVDPNTVTGDAVTVLRDGVPLVEGIHYTFSYDANNETIRLTPVAGIWHPNHVYVVRLNNRDQFFLTAPEGSAIADGQSFEVTDGTGTTTRFEFDSGYRLEVPATFAIQIPEEGAGPGGITEGETFVVGDGTRTVQFEFDSDGSTTAGNVPISITGDDTADDIAQAIIDALEAEELGLSPVYLGAGLLHLGSRANHTLDTSETELTQSGQPANVTDGETFTIDNGTQLVTFEFDDTSQVGGVEQGHVAIEFTPAMTHEELAQAIVAAIAAAGVGLSPTHLGDGAIHVGGTLQHQLNALETGLVQSGEPGVRPPFGIRIPSVAGQVAGIENGQTFTLDDGVNPAVRFEFDSTGTIAPGNRRITFTPEMPVNQLANAIITAIQNAPLSGLDPVHVGGGRIHLGGTTDHSLDTSLTALEQLGEPGVPATEPVPILPTADANQVALAIIQAINNSLLIDVTATAVGEANVAVHGAEDVVDVSEELLNPRFVQAIKDLAGNELKPNQLTGETQFTILLDVNIPPVAVDVEATTERNVAVVIPILENDFDPDGFLDPATVTITVMPQGGSVQVDPVTGDVTYQPDTGFVGSDFFRYTVRDNEGALSNEATVVITVTTVPWQNPDNPLDVNADGFISPIDALIIINRLNRPDFDPVLPAPTSEFSPPPFLDVNGDGLLTPLDALLVINELNRMASAGGEGESQTVVGSPMMAEGEPVDIDFGLQMAMVDTFHGSPTAVGLVGEGENGRAPRLKTDRERFFDELSDLDSGNGQLEEVLSGVAAQTRGADSPTDRVFEEFSDDFDLLDWPEENDSWA